LQQREKNSNKNLEDLNREQYVHLTTKGRKTGKPHTVELWFAIAERKIFLSHEGGHTDWMRNLIKDGSVVAEIGGAEFFGKARITDERSSSRELGKKALYEKYYSKADQETIDDWFSLSAVVEITPAA